MRTSKNISQWLSVAGLTLLLGALAGGTGAQAQSSTVAAEEQHRSAEASQERHLELYNTHTGKRINIVYRRGQQYIPAAVTELDYFLRDHRTGDVRHFDPRLYDILSDLTTAVGHPDAEIDIVCGYRTPSTNEALRARTAGVAKNSLHIQAEAIDLRMPGVDTLTLRRAALALARGGVGYYPHSDFIHVDTGRVRQWCFNCSASLAAGDQSPANPDTDSPFRELSLARHHVRKCRRRSGRLRLHLRLPSRTRLEPESDAPSSPAG
jgi:uncharacterized protein YcbK (DUF882 family)